jgi:hypothetical protein
MRTFLNIQHILYVECTVRQYLKRIYYRDTVYSLCCHILYCTVLPKGPVYVNILYRYSQSSCLFTVKLALYILSFSCLSSSLLLHQFPPVFFLTYDLFLFVEADFERDGVTRWGNSICLNRRLWTLFTLKNRPLQSFRCPELRVHRYKIRDLRFSYNYNSSTLRSYLNLDTVS